MQAGEWSPDDNPLRNAPHTAADVIADDWSRPYPREAAAFPVDALRADKYWPPVSRIDNAYGDRNVMCSCPPVTDWEELRSSPDASAADATGECSDNRTTTRGGVQH